MPATRPTAVVPKSVVVPTPDERRMQADLMREKNAREREAIQRNFAAPAPKRPSDLPEPVRGVGTQLTQEQVCRAAIATSWDGTPGL